MSHLTAVRTQLLLDFIIILIQSDHHPPLGEWELNGWMDKDGFQDSNRNHSNWLIDFLRTYAHPEHTMHNASPLLECALYTGLTFQSLALPTFMSNPCPRQALIYEHGYICTATPRNGIMVHC